MSHTCFVVLAVIAGLLACPRAAHGQSVTCELELSCSSCLGTTGCGWAADMTQCYAGTSSGPSFPFSSTHWIWGSASSCPSSGGSPGSSCSFSTCATCNANANCMWDGFSCIAGSNIGQTCTGGGSPGSSCSYSTCSACISNANCGWDGISCFPGSNVGSVCTGGIVADATGLGMGIIMVVIFVPVAIFATVTSAICWWYRRVYMIRRAAMVVTDVGLTAAVTSPYVAVQTGPGINTVVY